MKKVIDGAEYYVDGEGNWQGEFKRYDKGKLIVHCHYVDGLRHGEYKTWDSDGELEEHHHYVNGELHGEYKRWTGGVLALHCHYVGDLLHGEYKTWHYTVCDNGECRQGALSVRSHYVNGELHGEYRDWYDNGQAWEHSCYVNGHYHGEFKQWHRNGQLLEHSLYAEDECVIDELGDLSEQEQFKLSIKYGGVKWFSEV